MNNLSRYSSDNLKTFIQSFKDLAHAKEGERGRIDVTVDPKSKKNTYKVAITYPKPEWWWGRVLQNTQRTVYGLFAEGHTSDEFFSKLKDLFVATQVCIEDMQHDTDAKKSKRLYRLKEAVQSAEKAIEYLVLTYQNQTSSYNKATEQRQTSALEDYRALAAHLQKRIASVGKAAEEHAEEHVLHLMRLLFPPAKAEGDLYAEHFNAHLTIPYLNKRGVQLALSRQFGAAFTAQIFQFYRLDNPAIEIISPTKVKCLIVSALANLNLDALQHMKALGEGSFFAPILNAFKGNASEWTDEQLCVCLARLRNFSQKWIKPSLVEKQPQFLKDLKFLAACRAVVNYMPIQDDQREHYFTLDEEGRRHVRFIDKKDKLYYLRHFGDSEFGAKKIAYALCRKNSNFIDGVLYPNFVNNRLKCQEAHKIVAQPGLYAIGSLPLRVDGASSEEPSYFEHTPSLRIIFRGSSDGDSWWRNLSPTERGKAGAYPEGPGSASYEAAQLNIHIKVEACLKILKAKFPQQSQFKIKLEGDSLAGTDIQRCLKVCALWLKESKEAAISAVELYAFSSPGVEKHVATEFVELVSSLPNTQFILRYFMADDDIVPSFGQMLMGWIPEKSKIPDNLLFSKFKFKWNSRYTQGSCVQTAKDSGCVAAVQVEVAGRLAAHQMRCLEYTEDKGLHCYSLLTTNRLDKQLKIGPDVEHIPVPHTFLENAEAINQQAMSGLFYVTEGLVNQAAKLGGCAPENSNVRGAN